VKTLQIFSLCFCQLSKGERELNKSQSLDFIAFYKMSELFCICSCRCCFLFWVGY